MQTGERKKGRKEKKRELLKILSKEKKKKRIFTVPVLLLECLSLFSCSPFLTREVMLRLTVAHCRGTALFCPQTAPSTPRHAELQLQGLRMLMVLTVSRSHHLQQDLARSPFQNQGEGYKVRLM